MNSGNGVNSFFLIFRITIAARQITAGTVDGYYVPFDEKICR